MVSGFLGLHGALLSTQCTITGGIVDIRLGPGTIFADLTEVSLLLGGFSRRRIHLVDLLMDLAVGVLHRLLHIGFRPVHDPLTGGRPFFRRERLRLGHLPVDPLTQHLGLVHRTGFGNRLEPCPGLLDIPLQVHRGVNFTQRRIPATAQVVFHLVRVININHFLRVRPIARLRGHIPALRFRWRHQFRAFAALTRRLVGGLHVVVMRPVIELIRVFAQGFQAAAQDVVLRPNAAGVVRKLLSQVAAVFPGLRVEPWSVRVFLHLTELANQRLLGGHDGGFHFVVQSAPLTRHLRQALCVLSLGRFLGKHLAHTLVNRRIVQATKHRVSPGVEVVCQELHHLLVSQLARFAQLFDPLQGNQLVVGI